MIKAVAIARGGECLSVEYKGVFEPLKFRCANGHIFERKASDVNPRPAVRKGGQRFIMSSWCPKCVKYEGRYIDRREYKAIKQEKWKREIDLYLERTGYTLLSNYPQMSKDLTEFQCKFGHKFSRKINQTMAFNRDFSGYCQHCQKHYISIQEIHDYAEENGGRCLNDRYLGHKVPHLFQCKNNHLFTRIYHDMKRSKTFCNFCEHSFGRWKLPNKTLEQKIKDHCAKYKIDLDNVLWNRVVNGSDICVATK